uniref:Uncharacterized protein n=1 Tax=Oryza brachyantha TaxID=4533 RepID=J3KVB1_ORYBR
MAAKHVTMPQRITTIPQYGNHDKTFHLTLPRQSHHTSGFTPSFTPSRAVPSCALVDPEAGEAFVTPRLPVHTPSRLPLPGKPLLLPGKGERDGVWTGNRGVTKASAASGFTKAQEGTARLGVKEGGGLCNGSYHGLLSGVIEERLTGGTHRSVRGNRGTGKGGCYEDAGDGARDRKVTTSVGSNSTVAARRCDDRRRSGDGVETTGHGGGWDEGGGDDARVHTGSDGSRREVSEVEVAAWDKTPGVTEAYHTRHNKACRGRLIVFDSIAYTSLFVTSSHNIGVIRGDNMEGRSGGTDGNPSRNEGLSKMELAEMLLAQGALVVNKEQFEEMQRELQRLREIQSSNMQDLSN